MYRMVIFLAIVGAAWPVMLLALDEPRIQALGSEGGAYVYKNHAGNVESVLDPPGGQPRVTVQPPSSPSMNLGPPLQLRNPPFQLPPVVAPAHPSPPEFPQKAR